MLGYCHQCKRQTKEDMCEECECIAMPVAPRDNVPVARHRGCGEVGVVLLPNQLGTLDKLLSCDLQLRLPDDWMDRDLREVVSHTDRFMEYRRCDMSWRYDDSSGRLHLTGRRSEGRCEWCMAFRKNLQNMAREEGRSFRNEGACLTV